MQLAQSFAQSVAPQPLLTVINSVHRNYYENLMSYLLVKDFKITVQTLELLFRLSEHGQECCDRIAETRGAIGR